MNVIEAVNANFHHYTRMLPRWANILIGSWILFAGLVYFGWIKLPEIGWWRVVIMAPVAVILLTLLLQVIVLAISWITAPARWALKKWKASK